MRLAGKSLSLVLFLSAAAMMAHSQVILGPPGSGSGSGGSSGASKDNDDVAHVTCMGTNGGTISINLTGYMLDLQHQSSSIGSQSGGAGAGKVTFSDVEVEVPVSQFVPAASALMTGQNFQSCELRARNAGGLVLNFKLVSFAEVQLLGGTSNKTDVDGDNEGTPVVRLTMSYAGLQVMSGGDVPVLTSAGASSVTNGWSQIKNTP